MVQSNKKSGAQETAACCCVDIGTVIDNEDCKVSFSRLFGKRQDAEAMLAMLTEKARKVESDPCEIASRIESKDGGVALDADFTFSCQVESMNFELALR